MATITRDARGAARLSPGGKRQLASRKPKAHRHARRDVRKQLRCCDPEAGILAPQYVLSGHDVEGSR